MVKLFLYIVLFALGLAQAQLFDSINPEGVVNAAAVQSSVSNVAAADADAVPLADTSYQYAGQHFLGKVLVEMLKTAPEGASSSAEEMAQIETAINQILDQYDTLVQGIGENPYDIGTAMAAFFEFSYDILHGTDSAPTDAQTLGAIKQWRIAISKTPELLQKTNEEKQVLAESLAGMSLFYLALIQNYQQTGQVQEAEVMKTQWLSLFKDVAGIELSQLEYVEDGLYVEAWMGAKPQLSPSTTVASPGPVSQTPSPTNPLSSTPTVEPQKNPLNPLAQIPEDPFVATFTGGDISLSLTGSSSAYTGELSFKGQTFPVKAIANAQGIIGTFNSGGTDFAFTASLSEKVLSFVTDGNTFALEKQAKNPLGN